MDKRRESTRTEGAHLQEQASTSSDRTLRQSNNNGGGGGPTTTQQASPLKCFFEALTRKKPLDCRTDTNLNRCLNLLDLTALGVGSTLGLGLYVLAGQVASNKAGPGVVISFALAALASAFSALCYAEFAGKVPRAGSAYAYSYITVGEFVAFIIGWNLILEYVIGASSVARGFSGYLCYIFEHLSTAWGFKQANDVDIGKLPTTAAIHNGNHHNTTSLLLTNSTVLIASSSSLNTSSILDSIVDYVKEYFDWPSVVIILIITMFILFGVKESTNLTMTFTTLNLLVVLTIVLFSFKHLNLHNWQLKKEEVPRGFGTGGFLPYGWSGVLAGSATCFFGFIGFDTIASSAEEAKNPKRNVPLSIILSLFISFLAYMAIAIVQTLLWPYYDQNKITILPYIFEQLQMPYIYWIVLFGAIAGLASSQLGGMYPLPRILYSMAQDKLIYSYLANIDSRLKLPVRATVCGSIFIALLACLLDIQDLADMVSIGTLAAYSLVSLSVLILRYEDRSDSTINDSSIVNNHLTLTDILQTMENCEATKSFDFKKQEQADEKQQSTGNKSKLTAKPATNPIHELGSKPLAPRLSNGFNSWFKGESGQNITIDDENTTNKKTAQQPSILNLLTKWKGASRDHLGGDFHHQQPNDESSKQSKILITILIILIILIDLTALCVTCPPNWLTALLTNNKSTQTKSTLNDFSLFDILLEPSSLLIVTCCILTIMLSLVMLMLSRLPTGQQESSSSNNMFQVPFVPLIPALSILVNTFLMLNLSYLTWVRFTVWMSFGLFIYFTYGIWNSEGYLLYLNR